MVRRVLWQGLPWLVASVAAVVAVQGFLGQAAIQPELSRTMGGVLGHLRTARGLTAETAVALAPLSETSQILTQMNSRLQEVESDLRAMNGGMGRLLESQGAILQGLRRLSVRTDGVVGALQESEAVNRSLLATTAELVDQTQGQAWLAERLQGLTADASAALRELNRRFRFLKR